MVFIFGYLIIGIVVCWLIYMYGYFVEDNDITLVELLISPVVVLIWPYSICVFVQCLNETTNNGENIIIFKRKKK